MGASNGVSQTNAQYVSWGTGVYDFDNDGLLDILIFHGGLIHLIPQEHTLFRGLGDGKFADVSRQAGPVLSERTTARGACFADYDNDGKVDAFQVNLGARARCCITSPQTPATGSRSSSRAQRAIATASAPRWKCLRQASAGHEERVAGSGYLSQDDGRLHFGLGTAANDRQAPRSLAQRPRAECSTT